MMRRTGLYLTVLSIPVLLGFAYVVFAGARTPGLPAARIDCHTSGTGADTVNLLVFGESWAAGGKFLADLAAGLAQRQDSIIRACSIGLPGRNTDRLKKEAAQDFPAERIRQIFEGSYPDHTLIMNGVNDVTQHVGAAAYAEATRGLVTYFGGASKVQVISIPRVDEETPASSSLSRIKRLFQRYWNDEGATAVTDKYRSVLLQLDPEISIIDYDSFIADFHGNETRYTADGAHLTDEAFVDYGRFLSKNVKISAKK